MHDWCALFATQRTSKRTNPLEKSKQRRAIGEDDMQWSFFPGFAVPPSNAFIHFFTKRQVILTWNPIQSNPANDDDSAFNFEPSLSLTDTRARSQVRQDGAGPTYQAPHLSRMIRGARRSGWVRLHAAVSYALGTRSGHRSQSVLFPLTYGPHVFQSHWEVRWSDARERDKAFCRGAATPIPARRICILKA
jgi:hypothetical protein